ncbi:hypothetical protein [Actinorugispora endophytica]|uniref:Uncharacterized protein n=1 Tax=Actinorugispora endophytica TaxID=1605990 RepID=A0A4R6V0Z3_9ACTN|nr:hypothetical protein [Actinorugispora endophytica]TDQ53472.1 hypothetical protein EV190_104262 [Actinorugispora endophytica]
MLAVAGSGMVLSVLAGAVTAPLTDSGIAKVLVVTAVAAVAKLAADVRAFGPPAGLMFVSAVGAAARLRAALDSCRAADAELRRVREKSPEALPDARDRLTRTVVALREAHSVAGGEPWTRGFSPEEVTAAEQAAYHSPAAAHASR